MRELYLHIGLHKTGTSYLQRLLVENCALLRESGVGLAPYMNPATGAHHPIFPAIEQLGVDHVFDEIARTPGQRVVVSAERFCLYLMDDARARAIREAASRHFALKIVVFLRRQDHLKESVYTQIAKEWFEGSIFDEQHYEYDHDARLRRLEGIFGRESIVVRLYEADRSDLAGAFFDAIGASVDVRKLGTVRPQNVSMSRRKLLFMSQVPKPPEFSPPRLNYPIRFLARIVAASSAIADDASAGMMSPRQHHDLVLRHLAGNQAVVSRYAIENSDSFLELPDPGARWAPPEPIRPAERWALYRETVAAAWRGHNPVKAARVTAHLTRIFSGAARNGTFANTNQVPRNAAAAADFR